MAAKKKTQTKPAAKTPKPSFKAPSKAPARDDTGEGGEEDHAPEGFGGSQSWVAANQLGASKDLLATNREFAAAMNKDGRKRVVMANDAPNVYALRRPTGIIQLDADIGGGFPAGGMSVISGPDNVGKSWLLQRTMAMHQRLYGQMSNIAYTLAEGAFDFARALECGLVISVPDEILSDWNAQNLQIGLPGYTKETIDWFKRQVGGFDILRGGTGEETMHVVNQAVIYNRYNIIGVDSFSIMLPEADEHKDIGGTPKRAGNANLMTDFVKKYTPNTSGLVESNPTTLIGIMQVRANAEKSAAPSYRQQYMKDWATTGAHAVKHGKLIDLTIWDGQKLRKTVQGHTVVYGKVVHWLTEKGKVGCHDNSTGETEFLYKDATNPVSYCGHDDASDIINIGVSRGVFIEEKNLINVHNPITRLPVDVRRFFQDEEWYRWQMKDYPSLRETMQQNFEFELEMRYYVLAALGVKCLYRPLQ
jgi:hypothetical protein